MRLPLLIFVATAVALPARAQTPPLPLNQRVLVVYNSSVKESKKVAEYYMRRRGIPARNLCRIWTSYEAGDATVSWEDFPDVIRNPVRKCLQKLGADAILYIVFSYGSPYRISGVSRGYGMSVDHLVADIWDRAGQKGSVANPYYAGTQSRVYPAFVSLAEYRARPGTPTIYSVWRLDAATPALAEGLVDKAVLAEGTGLTGKACIDRRYGPDMASLGDEGYNAGDWDLHRAAQFLREKGVPVVEDANGAEFGTPPAPARCDDAIYYAGWYSLNHYNDVFSWRPGALGFHLDSMSLADPRGGSNWGANAIMRGLTVTSGAVDEPFLWGLPHVDGMVHDLLAGANIGDAVLRNTALLRWMIINVGDPLYRPKFRSTTP